MPLSVAILAPSPRPFQVGGAEKSLWALHAAFSKLPGCMAELLKLPVGEDTFADIISAYEQFSQLDLTHFDMLVTVKYPAWICPHPNHRVFMYHTLRGVYDTYKLSGCSEELTPFPAKLADLKQLIEKPEPDRTDLSPLFDLCRYALSIKSLPESLFRVPGPLIRRIVRFIDRIALAPAQIVGYFALSSTVANRPDYFPANADIKILNLPSHLVGLRCGSGKYFFTASRLTSSKRIHLLIEAMKHVKADIPLKIAGTGPELPNLRKLAAPDARIEFLGAVTDEQLINLYADALAVPFVPQEEDYGLITIEALKSGKPVLTTSDAGGPCELIRHESNGLIVAPNAEAIGRAMDRLANEPAWAKAMGENGSKCVAHLDWNYVATQLTNKDLAAAIRTTALVVAPYQPNAHGSGGERRLFYLCRQLSQKYDVQVVCFGNIHQDTPFHYTLALHVEAESLPWPAQARDEAIELSASLQTSVDDLLLAKHAAQHKPFLAALENKAPAFCMLIHPWLFHAVAKVFPDIPLIYDAQNVESDLKKSILGATPLAHEAHVLERKVCHSARIILGCSREDLTRLQELHNPPHAKMLLMPNGCEPVSYRRKKAELRKRLPYQKMPLILFIGSGHKPNTDAALAIFDIAAKIPEAQFLLAGSVCGEAPIINTSKPDNVHLLNIVSENIKNVLLEACDIAVNPMTTGSGTNLKMVEYLSAGLETVSTPFGMRGLPKLPGAHLGELDDFPKIIRHILSQPMPPEQLADTATKVQGMYSWAALLTDLCPSLATLLDAPHAAHN